MGEGSVVGRATFRAISTTVATAAILSMGVLAVSHHEILRTTPDKGESARPEQKRADANRPIVTLDAAGQKKGGITTAPLQSAQYQQRITAFGTVLTLDRLAALYNNSLTLASQLEASKAKFAASQYANEHAQKILKVFTTAVAQAESAEAAQKVEAAGVDAAQTQIDAMRNTAVQDWGPVLGAAIASRAALAQRLVLRKSALIQVSLPPGQFAAPPHHILLRAAGGPDVEADYVSEAVQADPKAQNIGYFYTAPMVSTLLPGLSLVASLPKGESGPGLIIPPEAVVWQSGSAWIYLRSDLDSFVRYALGKDAIATEAGGFVVPSGTLPDGAPLVVAGAQALLSEEARSQYSSATDADE